jgi:hypothetical protein
MGHIPRTFGSLMLQAHLEKLLRPLETACLGELLGSSMNLSVVCHSRCLCLFGYMNAAS